MNQYCNQNNFNFYNYENRSKLVRAYWELIERQDFQWHLTGNFNRETTYNQGRKILKDWSARVDRKLHGRNFHLKGIDKRLFFIAIPENGDYSENLHYHILAKLPEWSETIFPDVAMAVWQSLVKTGDLFVQRIGNSSSDMGRVVSYDLKDCWKQKNNEQIIFSSEFWPMH